MIKKFFFKNGKINYEACFLAGLLLAMLLRAFFFGIDYFCYLDDNNIYGVFNRRNSDIWNNIIMWYKMYTYRPLAFMLDAYLFQWLWNAMWLPLLGFTIMHFALIYLFKRVMEMCKINFGVIAVIICGLTPILIEAVYWIAASTRILPGMFFSVLSSYILLKYLNRGYKRHGLAIFLYFLTNLISTGFYEQVVVFNFVFTVFILWVSRKRINEHKLLIFSTPFISTFAIGAYYILFWNTGRVASRGQMVGDGLVSHFVSSAKGILNLLVRQNWLVLRNGVSGFFNIGLNPLQWVIIALLLGFSVFAGLYMLKFRKKINPVIARELPIKLILGVILAAAPFAPFFILKNNYMSLRAVFPSIFGIALFIDAVCDVFEKNKACKAVVSFSVTIVCAVFFMVNITEIHNYKLVADNDDVISENFLAEFEKTDFPEDAYIAVLDIEYLYSKTSREGYENISSSDWAFLGKVNAVSEKFYFKNILPVKNGFSIPEQYVSQDTLYFSIDNDMNIERLYLSDSLELYNVDNIFFGKIENNTFIKFE